MKKVKQTDCSSENGNCLSACIASLLNIDINTIPDYQDDGWFYAMNKWLKEQHGWEMMNIQFSESHMPTVPLIAVGESQRYKGKDHAVLWQNSKLLFDPSPTNKGIKGSPKYYIVLLKDF